MPRKKNENLVPLWDEETEKKESSRRKLGKRVKEQKYSAYIATPAYEGKVDTDYCQSLAEASYCAPAFSVSVTHGVMGNGAFIELSRNVFVKLFLEKPEFKDCTHLFFIDADLKFPPQAFIGLMRADLPIVAGVYRRRQEPEDYPVILAEYPDGGGLWVTDDGFIMANRVPTGFLCIKREVLEDMAKDAQKLNIKGQDGPVAWLFETKIDEHKRYMGEDFVFSDKYTEKYDVPIHVWPDIDFVHGGFEGNYLKFLERKIEENESIQFECDDAPPEESQVGR